MLILFILLLLGFLVVIKGADFLIDGASSLAKRLNVPEIVIGLTIVAFGTSAPELVVNIFSSIAGKNELVLGNIIGSNVFNTLFITWAFIIIGFACLFFGGKLLEDSAVIIARKLQVSEKEKGDRRIFDSLVAKAAITKFFKGLK
jgi:Ca2+/Na+ antiporter